MKGVSDQLNGPSDLATFLCWTGMSCFVSELVKFDTPEIAVGDGCRNPFGDRLLLLLGLPPKIVGRVERKSRNSRQSIFANFADEK